MYPSDEDLIAMDANGWIKGLVCYEEEGIVNDEDSPIMKKFIEKNKEKLITPEAVEYEVRRNLGLEQIRKNKKSGNDGRNILKKLCEDAGYSESTTMRLTNKTGTKFDKYIQVGHRIKEDKNRSRKQARVDEIWKMFSLIFDKNYKAYKKYARSKGFHMPKNGCKTRTPEGWKRHKRWKWWYPPPGDIDIIAFTDFCAEKSGLRVWVLSYDSDFKLFFKSIEKGVFNGTPYVRRPVCGVKLLNRINIEAYLEHQAVEGGGMGGIRNCM